MLAEVGMHFLLSEKDGHPVNHEQICIECWILNINYIYTGIFILKIPLNCNKLCLNQVQRL